MLFSYSSVPAPIPKLFNFDVDLAGKSSIVAIISILSLIASIFDNGLSVNAPDLY